MKVLVLALSCLLPLAASAQGAGDPDRGSVPPGTATDGSRPQDGAIQGGPLVPGEQAGVPGDPAPRPNACHDLRGRLREQCLQKEQGSSAGTSRAPDPGGTRPTPDTPPPQNPR